MQTKDFWGFHIKQCTKFTTLYTCGILHLFILYAETATVSSSNHSKTYTGAIAGGTLAIILVIALAAGLVIIFCWRRRYYEQVKSTYRSSHFFYRKHKMSQGFIRLTTTLATKNESFISDEDDIGNFSIQKLVSYHVLLLADEADLL